MPVFTSWWSTLQRMWLEKQLCECGFKITAPSNYHVSQHKKSKRHRQALVSCPAKTPCLEIFFHPVVTDRAANPEYKPACMLDEQYCMCLGLIWYNYAEATLKTVLVASSCYMLTSALCQLDCCFASYSTYMLAIFYKHMLGVCFGWAFFVSILIWYQSICKQS